MKSSESVSDHVNDLQSNETLLSSSAAAYSKRPVSMYETREGPHTSKSHTQSHDQRTANSMYQMNDDQAKKATKVGMTGAADATAPTTNGSGPLPHSDDVKHQTDVVTRRIQELWSVMQEMTSNDVFVPGAERIRVAVSELTALFPAVIDSFKNKYIKNHLTHFL